MPSQEKDQRDHVATPENQAAPSTTASDHAGESTELTVQELEQRIAPLVVRKAGGIQNSSF
jgi:hypothetical protein